MVSLMGQSRSPKQQRPFSGPTNSIRSQTFKVETQNSNGLIQGYLINYYIRNKFPTYKHTLTRTDTY